MAKLEIGKDFLGKLDKYIGEYNQAVDMTEELKKNKAMFEKNRQRI